MVGYLSVFFSNIYLTKLEKEQAKTLKPKFYCRFNDDMIDRWLKNSHDLLFENLNCSHEKIKFTIDNNQQKFLDTQVLLKNDVTTTEVYRKANKFLVQWKSQVPKRNKRNAINRYLYRSRRISGKFLSWE